MVTISYLIEISMIEREQYSLTRPPIPIHKFRGDPQYCSITNIDLCDNMALGKLLSSTAASYYVLTF